ncbi:cytochrome P450 2W1 [Bombina bombina]|uniref:cytochrome P450 2W1 n=1 Tax=Bombina bombina TaxID=8345 RepID=UPI00235A7D95|nr:cytochrome P450 2W1 [Bombina bombina]
MSLSSEGLTLLLLITVVMLCMKQLFSYYKGNKYHLPPGPTPLPIIGNLHLVGTKRQDLVFMKLAEKYGPIFTFYLGSSPAVVLVGYDVMKEALLNSSYDFGNRAPVPLIDNFQHGQGVFFSNGEIWKTTRRFALSILRDLGMGKSPIEGKIIEELHYLNELIRSYNGKPFNQKVFGNAPPNITFGLLFGKRFDYDHPTFRKIVKNVDDIVILAGTPEAQFYNVFPILGYILNTPHVVVKKVEEIQEIMKKLFVELRESLNENCWRTYTEAFMLKDQMETNTAENGKIFQEKNLLASMFDIILGGTETTAATIQWGILFLMKYPHIQKKAQEEIESVIGLERPPTWDDQKCLPYCLAMVHEIQRLGNILQFIPHATAADAHFRGYFIPKGTLVIPLLTGVLYDKTQWATPREFNPDHFLDSDGKFLKKDAFYPFSKGRRACAGESLARMEVFIFIIGLLQKFTFTPPPGVDRSDLDMDAEVCFTLRPKYYNVCAIPRT